MKFELKLRVQSDSVHALKKERSVLQEFQMQREQTVNVKMAFS